MNKYLIYIIFLKTATSKNNNEQRFIRPNIKKVEN